MQYDGELEERIRSATGGRLPRINGGEIVTDAQIERDQIRLTVEQEPMGFLKSVVVMVLFFFFGCTLATWVGAWAAIGVWAYRATSSSFGG